MYDSCPDHGCGGKPEADGDLLDCRETKPSFSETWIQELIADGNEDDQSNGVKIIDHVVWDTVERHSTGLVGEVVCQLAIGEPVERVPAEDCTGCETTADLIDPGVIEGHPLRSSCGLDIGWLSGLPECSVMSAIPHPDRIDGPATPHCKPESLECLGHDRTSGWCLLVPLTSPPHDGRSRGEEDGWQGEREPESHIFFGVDHTNLANESTEIDEEIEIVVDSALSDGGIDNDSLTRRESFDERAGYGDLFDH